LIICIVDTFTYLSPSLLFRIFFLINKKSHGFAQLSLARPGPESSGLPNVLYCGASTRPGNGVPLVLIGAKQVAKKAIQSLRRQNVQE